jgi:hypothetical protein
MGQLALSTTAITAWGLAGATAIDSPFRPHRAGAWTLRFFWVAVILTLPFDNLWSQTIQVGSSLFGFAMLFSFMGRLYRIDGQHRAGNIADLVAVFGFILAVTLLWAPPIPNPARTLALFALAIPSIALFWRLPTSEVQMSDADHRR